MGFGAALVDAPRDPVLGDEPLLLHAASAAAALQPRKPRRLNDRSQATVAACHVHGSRPQFRRALRAGLGAEVYPGFTSGRAD